MNRLTIYLLSAICAFAPALRAADAPGSAAPAEEAPAEFKSENPAYREADAVLNEARTHMGSADSAAARAQRLESMAAKFPDYPYRADVLYYAGLNYQMLKQNEKAIAAFEAALRYEPDIAKETPIQSYLKTLKSRTFVQRTNALLLVLLVASLALALGRLLRADVTLPWGRLVAMYGLTIVIWMSLVMVLPGLLGAARTGLAAYPKPVLSNMCLGHMGDAPLRALLWYGAGAILATLPIMTAVATLRSRSARVLLSVLGVVAVVGAIMGLFGIRYCYADAQVDRGSNRILFLARIITTKEEVPDEMLPLYDKSFQQRVLASRHKPAAATNAAAAHSVDPRAGE